MKLARMTVLLVVMGLLCVGCATRECTVIGFSPTFRPRERVSREDVLAEVNSQIPFEIARQDFSCDYVENELIAWVIVDGRRQRQALKKMVVRNEDYRLLTVGYFQAQDRDLILVGSGADWLGQSSRQALAASL